MNLEDIYRPISKELNLVEKEILKNVNGLGVKSAEEILGYFFKNEGKYLRPALSILAYKALKPEEKVNTKLIKLATAMELIHNASLIHDDVIDEDLTRRGQATLNNAFGNKLAVLAGDTLYTWVFLMLLSDFSKEYSTIIAKMAEGMCLSEIEAAKETSINSKDKYFKLIQGKTAEFMSTCCYLGAKLAGSSEKSEKAFQSFGLNFGMTYQVVDDYLDEDKTASKFVGLKDAEDFALKCKQSISAVDNSVYKESLISLIDYVLEFTKRK